jgi:hypothetical protein
MKTLLAISLLLVMLTGCAGTKAPVHPGAANTFDSTTYDTLVTMKAGIEQAKVGISDANKPLLNRVIDGWNAADALYKSYHTAALAGKATQADQDALAAKVASVNADLNTLKAAK